MSRARDAAWAQLKVAAKQLVDGERDSEMNLHKRAMAYAAETQAVAPAPAGARTGPDAQTRQAHSGAFVIPFGRSQGVPIGQAETKDLEAVARIIREGLDDPARSRYRAKNELLLRAIDDELETR